MYSGSQSSGNDCLFFDKDGKFDSKPCSENFRRVCEEYSGSCEWECLVSPWPERTKAPFSAFTWGNWGPWGSCSVDCDTGTQQRDRTCSSGTCTGDTTESQNCNTQACGEGTTLKVTVIKTNYKGKPSSLGLLEQLELRRIGVRHYRLRHEVEVLRGRPRERRLQHRLRPPRRGIRHGHEAVLCAGMFV